MGRALSHWSGMCSHVGGTGCGELVREKTGGITGARS